MEKNIKILLIMPFFYPHKGGSQKYAEDIYTQMIDRHKNVSVDVLAYNTDGQDPYEHYKSFDIYRIPCLNVIPTRFVIPNPFALLSTLKKLEKNKYDIVNTHIRFFDPTWWAWKYAKKINAKSFFTGHVATHPVHQSKVVEAVAKIVDLTLAKSTLKKYDLVTYVSNATKEFFEKTLETPKGKGTIVYGSIDTSLFSSNKSGVRKIPSTPYSAQGENILITYVGRVIWTKGITYLYDAIKELQNISEFEKCTFVIAGPGELEKKLRKDILRDNLQDKVILTGSLNYTEVQKLLSISDVYINPSHHSEGFPITILEAGASGCYVIATDNAGTSEVVRPKETGDLIEQRSVRSIVTSIKWAINNKKERENMATKMQKQIRDNFDFKVTSEKLYQLLVKTTKNS